MSTKAFCTCGGGSNLILGTGTENQIFILITPADINYFHHVTITENTLSVMVY